MPAGNAPQPDGHSVARAALLIAAVTVVARLAGFARTLVFARAVGPSCLGDAYVTSNTIPNILFDVVAGGALSSVVVPVLAGSVTASRRADVDRTSSALLSWCVLLLVPVAVVGGLLAHPLSTLLLGHGHAGCPVGRETDVAARMLVVFMPQVVLYGVGIVLTGVVQAHRRFLGPAVGPLASSLVVIAAYLTFAGLATRRETDLSTLPLSHELVLSVGTTLGVLALVLPLLRPTARSQVRLRPTLRFPAGIAATVRRMAISGAVVLAGQDLATAVVLRLANDHGSNGSVVLYNLAWTVFLLPWAVLAVPLATSVFPTLTARWDDGDRAGYADAAARSTRVVLAVAAGAAATMAATSGPAARLVVLGAPGHVPPTELARALATFAPGVVGFSLMALLSRSLYAQRNARTPAVLTTVGWALSVGLDIGLALLWPRSWTVAAVGAGTSVGLSVTAIGLVWALRRSTGPDAVTGVARTAVVALAGAVAAALLGTGLERVFAPSSLPASLGAAAVVAGLVVAVQALVVRVADPGTAHLVSSRLARPRARLRGAMSR